MDIHSYTTDEILALPLTKQEDFHESLEKKDSMHIISTSSSSYSYKREQTWSTVVVLTLPMMPILTARIMLTTQRCGKSLNYNRHYRTLSLH